MSATAIKIGVLLALVVVIAGSLLALGHRISTWHDSHERLPKVEAALKLEQDCGDGSRCAERAREFEERANDETLKAVSGLASELAALRARNARTRVVRVCPDPSDLQGADAAPRADAGATGTGSVHGSTGRDIGADLYALAAQADEVAARCRALQGWTRALATPAHNTE